MGRGKDYLYRFLILTYFIFIIVGDILPSRNLNPTMPTATLNRNLNQARAAGNDEFYTRLSDIEKEVKHYRKYFKGKVVLCNCDDPRESNFFDYFSRNFEFLQLKKLITTCYKNQQPDIFSAHDSENAVSLEYEGDKNKNNIPDPEEIGINKLNGDGDFRSTECVELLKQSDIVVTNPPFSLFREYAPQLIEHGKKFLILGNMNAIIYKEIFKFIKANQIWLGVNNGAKKFYVPDHAEKFTGTVDGKKVINMGNVIWYTNLDNGKRHQDSILTKTYKGNEKDYPKYDNYDAIDVSKVKNIPIDYDGVMGVPVNFMSKYNPEQFEILGSNRGVDQDPNKIYGRGSMLNNKETFKRLFIKHKQI